MTEPKPILQWSCDSCTKQMVTLHTQPGSAIVHPDAPDGWVRIAVLTKAGSPPDGFRWLCDECAGFIRRELPNALGLDTEGNAS